MLKDYYSFIYGLNEDFIKRPIPQTSLLLGTDLLTSLITAKLFAINKLCKNGMCLNCSVCRRIKQNIYQDVTVVNKSNILVDDILNICERTLLAKQESDYNFFIISDFAKANEKAQNKLLKTLEEPQENTFFVLCASNANAVLNTIKSRCITIFQKPISSSLMKKAMLNYYPNSDDLDIAINMGNGNLQFANDFLDDDNNILDLQCAFEALKLLKSSEDILRVSKLLLDKKHRLEKIVEYIKMIFLNIISKKFFLSQIVLSKKFISDIIELEGFFNESAILRIMQQLTATCKRIALNGNSQSIIDEMLFMILECRYNARILV